MTGKHAGSIRHDGQRHFVNRKPQLATFSQLMKTPTSAYMVFVHGPAGIGKSALLRKLEKEHCDAGMSSAWLDFENEELFTPQAVVDKLRDALGGLFSSTIRDALRQQEQALVAAATKQLATAIGIPQTPTPAATVIGKVDGVAENSAVAIGSNIVQLINPSINFTAGMEGARLQAERQQELSEVVRDALMAIAAKGSVIIFFDGCNTAPTSVLTWLCQKILTLVQQQRIKPNGAFIMVLAGDLTSARGNLLRTIVDWHDGEIIHVDELGTLQAQDVQEYWETHRKLDALRIPAIYLQLGVSPRQLVQQADLEQLGGNGHG